MLRPDSSALVLTTDRKENVSAFNALALGDGGHHAADVGAIEADAQFLFALLGGALWSWPTVRLLFRQARKKGLRGLAAMALSGDSWSTVPRARPFRTIVST